MLQTKNLTKIYKPKKGVPVTALNGIDLIFPEKGMVFLLGKSGSGKSTLLNVLGGLDKYNGGEIIIKGKSSKDFKQKHFDSYRNTYVGFIFQEYNLLDDFSVGANIALAIELQNRKATDEQINRILEQVDLDGYGNRKPNELSGGQKQRVAIARALVKNPQIIMADEPTGALDSTTGKQVLDTLKKLSAEKLVIVVSHDREFAETYADRIIELADGVVISDVEFTNEETDTVQESGISFNDNTVEISEGYHLTEQDRIAINEYIDRLKQGKLKISISQKSISNRRAVKTDEKRISLQDGSAFKLIKSKLPLKNAFKMGASGLKHKKIRLCITILLSCIAFGLFGLSDTFGSYNHIQTCTNSLLDSNVNYVATAKSKKTENGINSYWRDYGYSLSENDLQQIEENTGVQMQGVYVPYEADLSFSSFIDNEVKLTETEFKIYSTDFSGFVEINENTMKKTGLELLAGRLPLGNKNEIAISEYIFEVFKKAKYTDATLRLAENQKPKYQEINGYSDIIGKKIAFMGTEYIITAVIDTGFNIERYEALTEEKTHQSEAEKLLDFVLYSEFDSASVYSYAGLIMTGEGYINTLIATKPNITRITEGYISFSADEYGVDTNYMARLSDLKNEKILWVNGEKQQLAEKEIIVTSDSLYYYGEQENVKYLEDGSIDYIDRAKKVGELSAWGYTFSSEEDSQTDGYKIVGIINTDVENAKVTSTVICNDELYNNFTDGPDNNYSFSVGSMPKKKSDVRKLVAYCYREDSDVRYQIQNSVTYELDAINELLQQASKIFLYIGLGFAAFAALMLSNFIGTSISYKKQEIGILRAIGSRSNDVFKIFFAESFIIAMINFLLSAIGVCAATVLINYFVRNQAHILVTVLHFGIRQVILLLAVSVAVAFIASFIPVKKIASKLPIDAIRDK